MFVKKRKEQFNQENNSQEEKEREYFKVQESNHVHTMSSTISQNYSKFYFQIY